MSPETSGDRLAAHLGERLTRNSPELARQWLEALRARLSEHPRRIFPDETLLNHIPQVLARLFAGFVARRDVTTDELVSTDLERLADLRRSQGYAIEELVYEFDLLEEIIFTTVLEEAAALEFTVAPAQAIEIAHRLQRAVSYLRSATIVNYRFAANRDLLERSRLLAEFSRDITHELRNRLNGVMLTLALAQRQQKADPEQVPELLERLEAGLRRLEGAATDVFAISFSQIQPVSRGGTLPFSELVEQVFADMGELAKERRVDLECGDLPGFQIDASRVQLVLVNLVGNAIKYCDEGKGERWVRVQADPTTKLGEWCVRVSDNGVGIPAQDWERIFEEYVRGTGGAAGSDGDGIGLALARRAIHQLGGQIWVESVPGSGSTFSFTLHEPASTFALAPREPAAP